MKVFIIENKVLETIEDENLQNSEYSGQKETGWYLIADSAVSNTGKPFYLPEGKGKVTASVGIAIRINRLGKAIAPKFASRYYSEFAPVLHFRLPDYRKKLEDMGLPMDASVNFDKSLIVGDFLPIEGIVEISLQNKGRIVEVINPDETIKKTDEILSEISRMNTIKMGDLLITAIEGNEEINEGDVLEVKIKGEEGFKVRIK